jgi:hypothetical protein
MSIASSIISGDYSGAKALLEARIEEIFYEKLEEIRERLVDEIYGDYEETLDALDEASIHNVQKIGRTKLIKLRVRGGKVQRRKKLSGVRGYTLRGGRMVRMSTTERRNRRMGARKAKIKRRTKMNQILRKRKVSLRKRRNIGL